MNKTVLLDCDYVILNINHAFNTFLQKTTSLDFGSEILSLPTFEWPYFKENPSLLREYAKEFQLSDLFRQGIPMPGAVSALKRLKQNGYSLHVLSSALADENKKDKTTANRLKNLHFVFGHLFDDVHILPWAADKTDTLKCYPKNSYFVEDSLRHALEALKIGHSPILLRSCFNEKFLQSHDVQNIPVFKTWDEITNFILDNQNVF